MSITPSDRRRAEAEAPTQAPGEGSVDVGAPTLDSASARSPLAVAAGTRIGRFVVTGPLGEGGMGVVVAAKDPELGRAVAIKLLRPDQRGQGGLRLGREAQAMAKLSHPNVVTVYDVGEHDGSTYIAMELVDGRTLRAWRGAAPRPWSAIVETYLAAGRGLAAAHAAGLVHRDFKPDNVLIGSDGRPRVTDFGLVAAESRGVDSSEALGVSLDSNLTVRGALLGTPAYMAPEQWRGDPVDARSDQFAFCVALWEALHGERPFGGETTPLLREAILDGTMRPPRASVPRWLTSALQRGLAREPAARWPTLGELLDHLAANARPRRGKVIAGVVAGVVIAGAAIAYASWPNHGASCRSLEQRMVRVWSEPRRGQVIEVFGEESGTVIDPLDNYASTWVAARVETCEADRRGEQTAAIQSTRAHCFDDALAQLDGIAGAIAGGTLAAPAARSAVSALPNLASCSDLPVLTALAPRPTDPARAKRLAAVEETLAQAETQYALGHLASARDLAAAARAEAEAVDYAPTLAGLLWVLGQATSDLGDNASAEEVLRASLRAADAGRDDRQRMEAYLGLISVLGDLGRWDEAAAMIADAQAALVRIQSPKGYQARLLAYQSNVRGAMGDDAGAVALLQQARALHAEFFGTEGRAYGELEYSLGGELLANGDVDGAEPLLEHARATLLRFLGEDAPMIAKVDSARSFVRYRRGDLPGAIALLEGALAIREKVEGADSPSLSNMVFTLGGYYRVAKRPEDAVATLTRALDLLEKFHGKDHPRVVMGLNELVQALTMAERYPEALTYAERAAEMAERLELPPTTEAKTHYLLAEALWPEQQHRSLALARQARDEFRAIGDEENAKMVEIWIAKP